jgi:hypothetical protein
MQRRATASPIASPTASPTASRATSPTGNPTASNRSSLALSDLGGSTLDNDDDQRDRLAEEVISTISSNAHLDLKHMWVSKQHNCLVQGARPTPGELTVVPFPLGSIQSGQSNFTAMIEALEGQPAESARDTPTVGQTALLSETLAAIRSEVLEPNQFTVKVPSTWALSARIHEHQTLLVNGVLWSIVNSRLTGRRIDPIDNLVEEVRSLVKASILYPHSSECSPFH